VKTPEISIVTPVYNGENYISDCAKSINAQGFQYYEWLIVDDSSIDTTNDILKKLATQDDRIRVFTADRNRGPIHARNIALQEAKGRYIAFLDIDDKWKPDKLEIQLEFMKEKKAILSYTSYRKFNNDGKIGLIKIPVPSRVSSYSLKKTCSIMASSAMYDTDKTGLMLQDITKTFKDDLYLWIRILEKEKYAYGIKKDLSFLRIHADSFTGNKLLEAKKQWMFYRTSLKLPLIKSIYYFCHYAVKGTIKYLV
jgi:glycosyltransferase involved in cell wall biosynthesis